MKKFNFAIVGATGMVGRAFIKVLEERNLPIEKISFFSSSKSAGSKIIFKNQEYIAQELTEESFKSGFDIALFSAGGAVSEKFAPIAVRNGCIVIDNSSAWRMDSNVPLVVPEVNARDIEWNKGIIANPNCSTIQAVVALKPLYNQYGIKRIIYTTFQAVSGAGMAGYNDLENGIKGGEPKKFTYPIFGNVIPQIDSFLPNGYTKEEVKMINETKKILGDDSIKVTATTVRVPVFNGHSESINIELKKPFELEELKQTLKAAPGLVLEDNPDTNTYPTPIYVSGKDETYVGRVRRDESVENGVNLWVVADNIRKGAATNAVQIAEELIKIWCS